MENFKKILISGLLIVSSFSLYGCGYLQNDVSFARTVFSLLVKDRYIVRSMIDWPSFRVLDLNIGQEYVQFKTEAERADYERAFISNFAKGFLKAKGSADLKDQFGRWRICYSKNPKMIVVAADNLKQKDLLFLFDIKHTGFNKKLAGIRILKNEVVK